LFSFLDDSKSIIYSKNKQVQNTQVIL
jgi:hypothetical protein